MPMMTYTNGYGHLERRIREAMGFILEMLNRGIVRKEEIMKIWLEGREDEISYRNAFASAIGRLIGYGIVGVRDGIIRRVCDEKQSIHRAEG